MPSNFLPIPKSCDNCGSANIEFMLNSIFYGENKGTWPYCYFCNRCRAMTNCHEGTNKPYGLMAVSSTRRLRGKLHKLFDVIWLNNWMTRSNAYDWLAKAFNKDGEFHISHMTPDELKYGIELMQNHADNGYKMFIKRKEKFNAKRTEQRQREGSRIIRRKFG